MTKRRSVGIVVLVAMAGAWELVSRIYTGEAAPGEPMVPGWEVVFTRTLRSLSDYWGGGLGVVAVSEGGKRTYEGALLAIGANSLDTIARLFAGLGLGGVGGTLLGLAVSWSRWTRFLVQLPGHVVRTFPLLAMIPLFQLWFGISFVGMMLFVAYGAGVIFFVGTINAVKNVPPIFIDYARVLGASRLRLYRTVILPAIFPELRSTILLSLGLGWTLVLGAEYLGAQTGLGQIIVYSEQFAYVDRMFLVALVFVLYASLSYALFDRLSRRLVQWVPRGGP
ncbi:MAG TPA: ABC transporter permease subunit [Gaiellaceae bacterium]|nr:ABC transporter permease subunit [Gaiellaceae bacterium]